jgi:hypothetical protein
MQAFEQKSTLEVNIVVNVLFPAKFFDVPVFAGIS